MTETDISGVKLIEPKVFVDARGCFFEQYQHHRYLENGMPFQFVQDNISVSRKGTIRGLHFQCKKPQGKLVSCIKGEIFDVAADIDQNSPTFGSYVGFFLSGDNKKQLWIPSGYAHGFCALTDDCIVHYKCTDYYYPEFEKGIRWNDSQLNIEWPLSNPLVSEKDLALPCIKDYLKCNHEE